MEEGFQMALPPVLYRDLFPEWLEALPGQQAV